MRIVSWNINGLQSAINRGLLAILRDMNADIVCIQEIRCTEEKFVNYAFPGYLSVCNASIKKGYAGTAMLIKRAPVTIITDYCCQLENEGRHLCADTSGIRLMNLYAPTVGCNYERMRERITWEKQLQQYVIANKTVARPFIMCGDFNVAHTMDDIGYLVRNQTFPGATFNERLMFTNLLDTGMIDVWRHLNPHATGCYSWWPYGHSNQAYFSGCRFDYFLIDSMHIDIIKDIHIIRHIRLSDHCPVLCELYD